MSVVDQFGNINIKDRSGEWRRVPNVVVDRDSYYANPHYPVTVDGDRVNTANGSVSKINIKFKKFNMMKTLGLTNNNELIIWNDKNLRIPIATEVEELVGHSTPTYYKNDKWWQFYQQVNKSIEVTNLPKLSKIIKIRGDLLLTGTDLFYQVHNNSQFAKIPCSLQVLDMMRTSIYNRCSDLILVLDTDRQLHIHVSYRNDNLIPVDNTILDDYNSVSKWSRLEMIDHEPHLINENGESVIIISDEGGIIRRKKTIPVEFFRVYTA